MSRTTSWILTYTGRQFWPLEPLAEEVEIEDIAHALSSICRFGGHCNSFYSVAQHSVTVSQELGGGQIGLIGLLHDAAEAYLGDMCRPIKRDLTGFQVHEDQLQAIIWSRFRVNVTATDMERLKEVDNRLLMTERRDLMKPGWWHVDESACYPFSVIPCSPFTAEKRFLRRFEELRRTT